MGNPDLNSSYDSLLELSQSYGELHRALAGASDPLKQIKPLMGDPSASSTDSWLIRTGVAFIAFPDPGIGEVIGVAMITAGLLRKRLKRLTIADMNRELQEMAKKIDGCK